MNLKSIRCDYISTTEWEKLKYLKYLPLYGIYVHKLQIYIEEINHLKHNYRNKCCHKTFNKLTDVEKRRTFLIEFLEQR